MEWLFYCAVLKVLLPFKTCFSKNASTHNGIFICPAPYWQGVCRADWLNLSIVRGRERFPLPARPPACCSGCPHRAEVSLWLPLELSTTESPAPDAARCLPSPVTVLRFTPMGRLVFAKLIVRRNLFKGKPLKAAAYWYSVVKFPTFRRKAYGSKMPARRPCLKACNKHKGFPGIFLLIKVGIFANPYPSLWVSGYLSPNSAMPRQKAAKQKTPKDFPSL